MASIQKRVTRTGAPAYIVKWRTPDGRHRTRGGFRTRKAAQAYATEVAHATQRGNTFDPKAGELTFRQAAEQWLLSRHDLKPTTISGYRYALAPAAECRAPRKTLGIDATFGGWPLKSITRQQISTWVATLSANGYSPATIRAYMQVVRQVLAQALADNKIAANPALHVKLPGAHGKSTTAVVDDPNQFLTAEQVSQLQNATPWPYNVLVHLAAWSGLRAGELAGLQVGDVALPPKTSGPNTPGTLRVERTVVLVDGKLVYQSPKTKGSKRTVPLPPATTTLLRGYLKQHPHAGNPLAPLFPALRLTHDPAPATPEVDWAKPLQHKVFYRLVFKPAVARANLNPALVFHSLRHTYVSLCVQAGIPPLEISRFAGHSTVTTTLGVYAHLFESDHTAAMGALGALAAPATGNVVPLRGRAR
jgi:integrase